MDYIRFELYVVVDLHLALAELGLEQHADIISLGVEEDFWPSACHWPFFSVSISFAKDFLGDSGRAKIPHPKQSRNEGSPQKEQCP